MGPITRKTFRELARHPIGNHAWEAVDEENRRVILLVDDNTSKESLGLLAGVGSGGLDALVEDFGFADGAQCYTLLDVVTSAGY